MRLPCYSARLTAGDRSGSRFVAERRGYADERADVWCMVFKEAGETPCGVACVPDGSAAS